MSMPSAKLRRRLCLALPVAVLAGTTSTTALAQSLLGSHLGRELGRGGFEVALNLDLFGESSQHVVRAWNTEQVTVSGQHGATPWRLAFIITSVNGSDQLVVSTKLMSGDDVLAAPMRTINIGQRVVVRADEAMNVALLIKKV